MSFSRGCSRCRNRTSVSCGSCIAGGFFTAEPPGKPHMHTTIYKIDNQRGPTVYHRELYSVSVITYKGKESEKEWICV